MKIILFLILLLFSPVIIFSQDTKNLDEKLGFDRNAKLFIVHADDLGLSHSTKSEVIEINHSDFGAKWRQHDLNFLLHRNFKKSVERS